MCTLWIIYSIGLFLQLYSYRYYLIYSVMSIWFLGLLLSQNNYTIQIIIQYKTLISGSVLFMTAGSIFVMSACCSVVLSTLILVLSALLRRLIASLHAAEIKWALPGEKKIRPWSYLINYFWRDLLIVFTNWRSSNLEKTERIVYTCT